MAAVMVKAKIDPNTIAAVFSFLVKRVVGSTAVIIIINKNVKGQ